jgi:hypothetical protein
VLVDDGVSHVYLRGVRHGSLRCKAPKTHGVLVVARVCVLAFLIVGCSASAQQAPTPPNIVFVLADDMRYDEVAYLDGLQ